MSETSPQLEDYLEIEGNVEEKDKLIPGLKLLETNVSKLQKNNEILMSENKSVTEILAPRSGILGNGQPEDLENALKTLQLKFFKFEGMNSEREQEKKKIIQEKERLTQEKIEAVQALKIYTDKNPITKSQISSAALVSKISAVKNLASSLNDFIRKQINTKP